MTLPADAKAWLAEVVRPAAKRFFETDTREETPASPGKLTRQHALICSAWEVLGFLEHKTQFRRPTKAYFVSPYKPGDRLYVKEAFCLQRDVEGDDPPFHDHRPILRLDNDDRNYSWLQPHYRATDPEPELACDRPDCDDMDGHCHWRSPAVMPRWASRIILEVMEVRREHLQQITLEDIIAEGLSPARMPCSTYAALWNERYANTGWEWRDNPWVWAVTVRRMVKP